MMSLLPIFAVSMRIPGLDSLNRPMLNTMNLTGNAALNTIETKDVL
ncbi:hypothetical protein QN239_05595 [Mycolicibacterium sp. Y3]